MDFLAFWAAAIGFVRSEMVRELQGSGNVVIPLANPYCKTVGVGIECVGYHLPVGCGKGFHLVLLSARAASRWVFKHRTQAVRSCLALRHRHTRHLALAAARRFFILSASVVTTQVYHYAPTSCQVRRDHARIWQVASSGVLLSNGRCHHLIGGHHA